MEWLLQAPILLFSLIVHEYAHGFVAYRAGDDTAALEGRLSFSPLDHIDPIGTILIPGLCIMKGMPLFGWARPVPVNVAHLHSPRWDGMRVSAAGIVSNLALATGAAVLFALWSNVPYAVSDTGITLLGCLMFTIQINLLLAFFNLIPVFPLDGSRVVSALLPIEYVELYERHVPYGGLIVLALVATGLAWVFISPGMYLFMTIYDLLGLL
jgi:Zn-dependent protease